MKINISSIGAFGISFSRDLDQTWFNMWRKEDHFDTYLYENIEGTDSEDEAVDVHQAISLEEGEQILRAVFEKGQLELWRTQYQKDDADAVSTDLNWTIDVDDLKDENMMMLSGNWKMPAEMQEVMKVLQTHVPSFGVSFGL